MSPELRVAFPGWSLDCEIWQAFELDWCGIVSQELLAQEKDRMLQASAHSVTLIGYSLGGYEALKWALAFPDKIKKVIIIGAGPAYAPDQIAKSKEWIQRSKQGYLSSFYKACFSNDTEYRQFMTHCGQRLVRSAQLSFLVEQLDYLGQFSFSFDLLQNQPFPVTFFHGVQDKILPYSKVLHWAKESKCVVGLNCGHSPFFNKASLSVILSAL